jgi:hypothetical protein
VQALAAEFGKPYQLGQVRRSGIPMGIAGIMGTVVGIPRGTAGIMGSVVGIPRGTGGMMGAVAAFATVAVVPMANAPATAAAAVRSFRRDMIRRPPSWRTAAAAARRFR